MEPFSEIKNISKKVTMKQAKSFYKNSLQYILGGILIVLLVFMFIRLLGGVARGSEVESQILTKNQELTPLQIDLNKKINDRIEAEKKRDEIQKQIETSKIEEEKARKIKNDKQHEIDVLINPEAKEEVK